MKHMTVDAARRVVALPTGSRTGFQPGLTGEGAGSEEA
jgi:hypothetical protein